MHHQIAIPHFYNPGSKADLGNGWTGSTQYIRQDLYLTDMPIIALTAKPLNPDQALSNS